jgi:hypothetical protein
VTIPLLSRGGRPLGRALLASAVACGSPRTPEGGASPVSADSLVVERTPCFGSCAVYRVRLTRAGDVRFEPRQPGRGPAVDTAVIVTRVDAGTLAALLAAADSAGVFTLPAVIGDAPGMCTALATDAPTVTTTRFSLDGERVVRDYLGCGADPGEPARRLARLRAWEARVDSTIGAVRWGVRRRP